MKNLNSYRRWFFAAAAYNAIWGAFTTLFPDQWFRWFGMERANYPQLMAAIGMIVGVYALGYWLIAIDPKRYGPFVFVGLLGKVFGPIGFLIGALSGQLPWVFGWMNVMNDLIWLPIFIPFSILMYREMGGWRGLLPVAQKD